MDLPSIKRRYLRKDTSTPIRYEWNGEMRSCLTTTLGEGGLYAQTLLPPPVGQIIKIEFELHDGHPIRVMGEVRHSLENTYGSLPAGFGVQFLDLAESDRQRIMAMVDAEEG
ncbi:MAG: PilZ domain-containing protein [Deltaproteobacteria bacterium]|nr:PilZ domain-containing protein [Deltaproteobacteria bacterium]